MKIEGLDNIIVLYQRELDSRWTLLEKKYASVRSKIFFTLLLMLNDFSKKLYDLDNLDASDYLRIPILLHTLDEFLDRGENAICVFPESEANHYAKIITKDYQYLGVLRNRIEQTIAYNEEILEYSEMESLYEIPMKLEEAFNDLCGRPLGDQDWEKYWDDFLKSSKIEDELKELFKSEFLKEHGITPMQLYRFEKYLQSEVRNAPDKQAIPFFQFTSEGLSSRAQAEMQKEGPIDPLKVESFLRKLEYNSERDWASSPFLRVELDQNELITVILPSVFLGNVLSGAWLQKTIRGTRTEGRRNKEYGTLFEEYVREILRRQGLSVNKGNLRIKSQRFPEICKCTHSSKIDIDVVAQSNTHVYMISCKAKDLNLGPKQLLSFFLYKYKTFFDDVIWDLDKAGEIAEWTTCVAKSSSVLTRFGFNGKKLIPMFITPDVRSLSLNSVRQWCIDERLGEKIPDAVIIRACELKDYEFPDDNLF